MKINHALRQFRETICHSTTAEMANKLGVNQCDISKIERGIECSPKTIVKYIDYFSRVARHEGYDPIQYAGLLLYGNPNAL